MTEKLFSEFKPSNLAEWKSQLIKDLKGEDFETLRWHNDNGFIVEPFYTAEHLSQSYEPAFTHCDWHIGVRTSGDMENINSEWLKALGHGAEAITVNAFQFGHFGEKILNGIRLDFIHPSFKASLDDLPALAAYLEKNYPQPLSNLAVNCGKFLPSYYQNWFDAVSNHACFSQAKLISSDTTLYNNLNCLPYYEVALAIAELVDRIEGLKNKKLPTSDFVVEMGVGTDYFVEMAKFRALRRLWRLIRAEYGIKNNLYLKVESTPSNKSISDRYNNLLRTTIEAMAAVAGGCNELVLIENDFLFPEPSPSSKRLAINQQHILKYESYFNKMADVGCGSYYIETLTDNIAERALETLKEIEKAGGYLTCHRNGTIWSEVARQSEQRARRFREGKEITIGVNKFHNEKENLNLSQGYLEDLQHDNRADRSGFESYVLEYELTKNLIHHAPNV